MPHLLKMSNKHVFCQLDTIHQAFLFSQIVTNTKSEEI